MNLVIGLLVRAYTLVLYLYPAKFQSAFGEEMRRVFSDALQDAVHQGFSPFISVFVRELRDMPQNIQLQYKDRLNFMDGDQTGYVRRDWLHRLLGNTSRFSEPGSWRDAFMASLPHVLFLVLGGIFRWLQSLDAYFVERYALSSEQASGVAAGCVGFVILVVLVIAWRHGWPLWSAAWYGYSLWGLMFLIALLNERIAIIDFRAFNNILILGTLLSLGIGYILLFRSDARSGLLAVLFLAPNLMLAFMENIQDNAEVMVYLLTGFLVVLAVGAIVRTRRLQRALSLVVVVNLAASLLVAYVQEFHGDFPGTYIYTPTIRGWIITSTFLLLLTAGLVLGPLLLWRLWDIAKRNQYVRK